MMGNGFGFGIPGLGMILVWVVIIVAVVALVRLLAGGFQGRAGGFQGRGTSARQLLDERFARGEIDRQEYEEKRRLLEQ
jgi:putative membrane protein